MDIINSSLETLPEAAVKKLKNNKINWFSNLSWYQNFIDTVIKVDKGAYDFLMVENQGETQVIFPVEYSVLNNGCRQLKSLTNYYSPIYQLIHDTKLDVENALLSNFFITLKTRASRWDVMRLQPMAQEDVLFLVKVLKKARIPSVSFFCFGNWYLEVNGRSFNQYLLDLKPKVRSTIGTKTKQFEKLEGAKIAIVTDGQDLVAAIKAYEDVYGLSWKNTEPYTHFISGFIKSAEKAGALRLGVAYLHDKPIAAQIWIVSEKVAYIFKVAYDEDYKQYAIGTVLTAKLMQYVIDYDKVSEVDYLQGDDAYKKNWMSHRRERWGILAFNTTTLRGNIEMLKEMSAFYFKPFWAMIKK